jgi:hypothetical protein
MFGLTHLTGSSTDTAKPINELPDGYDDAHSMFFVPVEWRDAYCATPKSKCVVDLEARRRAAPRILAIRAYEAENGPIDYAELYGPRPTIEPPQAGPGAWLGVIRYPDAMQAQLDRMNGAGLAVEGNAFRPADVAETASESEELIFSEPELVESYAHHRARFDYARANWKRLAASKRDYALAVKRQTCPICGQCEPMRNGTVERRRINVSTPNSSPYATNVTLLTSCGECFIEAERAYHELRAMERTATMPNTRRSAVAAALREEFGS